MGSTDKNSNNPEYAAVLNLSIISPSLVTNENIAPNINKTILNMPMALKYL